MKCRDIQDMILTDYLDGQIDPKKKGIVESHLKECAACREFLVTATEAVIKPFDHSESRVPPESIWQGIQDVIHREQEVEVSNPFYDVLERMKVLLTMPRTMRAMATVAVVLLITVTLFKGINYRQQQIARASQEEMEYLSYLSGTSEMLDGNGGYDTDIEAYFL